MKKNFNISSWQNRNRTFIVPSFSGLVFFSLIPCVFLVGAILNQDWSYLFGFTLLTIFLVGMFQTNSNLNSLEIINVEIKPTTVGNVINVECTISNRQKSGSFAVYLESNLTQKKSIKYVDFLEANSVCCLSFIAKNRGLHKLPPLRMYSRFPVGLFYSWRQKDFDKNYWVYPQPKGEALLAQSGVSGFGIHNTSTDEESIELKPFQEGDSFKHVDWKGYARGAPLSSKIYPGEKKLHFDLSWFQLMDLDFESRISQLALWVNECHYAGWTYNLLLPNKKILYNYHSNCHYDFCLRELSLIEVNDGKF